MQAKHQILVPVDGSDFSRQIIPYIREFFGPEENEITLLRVGERPSGHVGGPERPIAPESDVMTYGSSQQTAEALHPIYASQELASAAAEMTPFMQSIAHELEDAGYTVHTAIRFKHESGPAIVAYIDNHDVDLVAMTTHWRTGLGKLIFGSVAQYVAQHVDIPIVMVKPLAEA